VTLPAGQDARGSMPHHRPTDLGLVGADRAVPVVTGGTRRYVNLDYAASAPCLAPVKRAVDDLVDWYASVHRGAGFLSDISTRAYEGARTAVADFVGGRADDVVVFTRNTTDATNLLAAALPPDTRVLTFASEHHANLLPWSRRDATVLPIPHSPGEAIDRLDRALRGGAPGPRLVAVTGASNVTGELWPYEELTRVAHRHGARLLLDAAQLAPHRAIDMTATDVDYLAISGHKLYAPFGAGALIGRRDWIARGEPMLAGGGAVRFVTADEVLWADLPDRAEAGTPNIVGAVALGVACRTLAAADRDQLAATETALINDAQARLDAIPTVRCHRLWSPPHPRIGVLTFSLRGLGYAQLAAALSAEHGIGVRHGCFCAHPLITELLDIDDHAIADIRSALHAGRTHAMPGAVRMSIGLGTTSADIDRLVDALEDITVSGPRWTYRTSPDGKDCWPDPDPRPRPQLAFELA
jgi:selenocysteine lyase/cysteine desulfurase